MADRFTTINVNFIYSSFHSSKKKSVIVVKMLHSSCLRTTNRVSCRAWNCGCAAENPYPCRWPSSSWTRFPVTHCATFTEARKSWRTYLITPSSRSAIYVLAIKYPLVRYNPRPLWQYHYNRNGYSRVFPAKNWPSTTTYSSRVARCLRFTEILPIFNQISRCSWVVSPDGFKF